MNRNFLASFQRCIKLFCIGAQSQLQDPLAIVSRAFFLLLLLGIFSGVWQAFSGNDGRISADNVWYLFVAELVGIFTGVFMRQLRKDSKIGMLSSLLLKPTGILPVYISLFFGKLVVQTALIAAVVGPLLYCYLGTMPSAGGAVVIPLMLLVPCGLCICIALQGIVGICALADSDTRPYEFIMQKGMFLLGAMMLPLALFPNVLQVIAVATPFYWSMGGIAHLVIDDSLHQILLTVGCVFAWMIAVLYIALLLERHLTHRHVSKGGSL